MTRPSSPEGGSGINDVSPDPGLEERLAYEYSCDSDALREAVESKLAGLIGLTGIDVWAYFRVPSKKIPGQSVDDNLDREILLILMHEEDSEVATIRILSNEAFDVKGNLQFLSEDFTLDYDNDAQQLVDAYQVRGEPNPKVKRVHSPLFYISAEGELDRFNISPLTPIINTDGNLVAGLDAKQIIPFGVFINPRDRRDALDLGRSMFDEVASLEPWAYGLYEADESV